MTLLTAMVGALAGVASAQDARVELSGTYGWTWSDGVTGTTAVTVPGVGTFDRVDPKDSSSWGLRLGLLAGENSEIGFLFNQQSTELDLGGTTSVKLGDLKVYNYHGYYAYNFGDRDAAARPYILIGLGATQYGALTVDVAGTQQEVGGDTQFSGTGALGLKIFPGRSFGIRLEGRWTPTYIKSDAEGWWCDPYYGCYVVGDAQYSNQFELSGGITLRF
jgi:hypothetical protein